jgi:hypothetical protein
VSNQSEPAVEERQLGAVELAVKRETAPLLDRLERTSEQLERVELELRDTLIDAGRRKEQMVELEHQLGVATLQVADAEAEAARAQAESEQLRSALEALEQAHQDVLSSLSWRITGPLRRAKQEVQMRR